MFWLVIEGAAQYIEYKSKAEHRGADFKPWLWTCTQRKAIDFLRGGNVPPEEPLEPTSMGCGLGEKGGVIPQEGQSQEEEEIDRLNARLGERDRVERFRLAIKEALDTLRERSAETHLVSVLAYCARMKGPEIAKLIGKNEQRVASRQHQAIKFI